MVLLSSTFIVIPISYLIYSFNKYSKGYDYKEIPLLGGIHKYDLELQDYHKKSSKAEYEFKDYLIAEFIKNTDINTKINDVRSFRLYKAKQYIFYAIISFAVICIPYGINSFNDPGKENISQKNDIVLNNHIDSIIDYKIKLIAYE